MFQLKANEAKREAERLQRIALAKQDKSEEEFTSNYLKQRLNEAEAEKQYLYEKIKLQESSRASQSSSGGDPSQMLIYSKIHDLLYSVPSKADSQGNERHPFRTNPWESIVFVMPIMFPVIAKSFPLNNLGWATFMAMLSSFSSILSAFCTRRYWKKLQYMFETRLVVSIINMFFVRNCRLLHNLWLLVSWVRCLAVW